MIVSEASSHTHTHTNAHGHRLRDLVAATALTMFPTNPATDRGEAQLMRLLVDAAETPGRLGNLAARLPATGSNGRICIGSLTERRKLQARADTSELYRGHAVDN